MRILLVTQYFWPESFIINDIVQSMSSQGHVVDVLTGKPNYPDGDIYEGYTEKGFFIDTAFDNRVVIYRIPLRPRNGGGAKNLALNYLSFVVGGLKYAKMIIKNEERYDFILVFAPSPILSAIPALYIKWRIKSHLAIWIQDIWPESLRATGFVKNRMVLGLVGAVVRGIYFYADTLLIQSRAFRKVISKYSRDDKIIYYPNSCRDELSNLNLTTVVPKDIIRELEERFCVVFTGNLGTAQSVETLVRVVERLKYLPNFRLLLVGSGSMFGWIEKEKKRRGLHSLILAGRYPKSEMFQFYRRAEALLVTLKQDAIFSYTVPSKVQAYMAAGRPILAAIDGEGARIIDEAQAGFTCSAEDDVALSRCIERLYYMPKEERESLGYSGRRYFLKHFELNCQTEKLVSILEDRIKYSGGG